MNTRKVQPTPNQKANEMTRALQLLAMEEARLGNTNIANVAAKSKNELPDSSKMKLWEILNGK